jgi:hypothetical protein
VCCKVVVPFAVPFVEIYVPRNCADDAYVQGEGDVLADGCSYRLLPKQQSAILVYKQPLGKLFANQQ